MFWRSGTCNKGFFTEHFFVKGPPHIKKGTCSNLCDWMSWNWDICCYSWHRSFYFNRILLQITIFRVLNLTQLCDVISFNIIFMTDLDIQSNYYFCLKNSITNSIYIDNNVNAATCVWPSSRSASVCHAYLPTDISTLNPLYVHEYRILRPDVKCNLRIIFLRWD